MLTVFEKRARVESLSLLLAVPAGAAVVVLMLHTVANAVMQNVGTPIEGTIEYGAFWYMAIIVFLGMPLAYLRSEHIEASLLYDRMPAPVRREFRVVIALLMLAVSVAFMWFGWKEAVHGASIGKSSGTTDVVIWPPMFIVPIGCAALALLVVIEVVRVLRPATDPAPSVEDKRINDGAEGAQL